MRRKSKLFDNDEIDLIELFRIIWNGKKKILLITAISLLVGLGYSYQIPNSYLISLNITKNDYSEIKQINHINKILANYDSSISSITSKKIFDKFDKELRDYDEFLLSLKNIKKIEQNILNLPLDIQTKKLTEYVNLLQIIKNNDEIKLNLKWDNIDEAKDILINTTNLTFINLEKSIFKELDSIDKKKYDFKNLEYLKMQSWIAKELNISNIPYGYTGEPFYLRGYLAIDKEIEAIKINIDKELKFLNQEINFLKKENIKWLNHDIYSIKEASLKNTKLNLMISILLGLIVGTFFVIFSNIFQFSIVSKKPNN